MGCTSCGNSAAPRHSVQRFKKAKADISVGPCDYTTPMLEGFRDLLIWFKDKGLHRKHNIESKTMNSYIGYVLSSLNFNDKCKYKDTLDEISNLVDLIIVVQNG